MPHQAQKFVAFFPMLHILATRGKKVIFSLFWPPYTYINLAVVFPSICLSICLSIMFFQRIMARLNEVKTSPNLHHMEMLVSQTHSKYSDQCTWCTCGNVQPIFVTFLLLFCHFLQFWPPFLTVNEKTRPHSR